jgi:hypothetical protein
MTNEEIVVSIAELKTSNSIVVNRLESVEKSVADINELVIAVKELAFNMKNMSNELRLQGQRLSELEQEPAKNWNSAKRTAFTTIVSVVAGALAVGIIGLIYSYS